MDRIREARRGSMAAVNGSLSRRRQRSSGLRDSPEEDGAMEMQETSRLRDRGGKKDRDRDRSGRNKRRRGDRMLHGNHREEGEDSSEESVDEDDEDDEEDSSVAVRLQPSPAQNPAPAASLMQSHNIRKGYPVKPVRPPGTCTWKVAEEMIGAPIPRKARSSSVKRSQECSVSGGGGAGCGGGGEQISCQPSMSPVRRSPSSTAPVSPSSSNASIRKKMKPISVPKPRPPKTSKSSSIQEIEIEVAEVLFGMTRQIPSKQEDHRNDPKESNGSGNEVKSRVSSPNPISPPATSQPSTVRPSNPSINSFPLTATAPKRKRPRVRIEDESPTSPPSSSALPATSCSSVAKLDTEVVLQPVGTKTDPASPRSEKNASPTVENGGFSSDQTVSNVSSAIVFAAKVQLDFVKAESIQDLKDADNQPEKKAKEEAFSPPKATPANLDVNIEEALASKASMISDTQRDEKFSIDLMAPPGKSSPEIESNSDYVAECKPMEMENAPKPEVAAKAEGEKTEKKSKSEAEEIAHDDKNGGKPSADDSDSRKPAGKERNLDLQLDLEKLDKDVTGAIKHQGQKQQSKAPRTEPKTEKAGPTASLPMPMQITGWPGGFPPFGFMGQVPPLPPVVPVDGTSNSSKLSFLPSQLRPKRCAAHCYIAQNIHYHQQITRLNPFWPSSAGAAPLFASKQYNLNTAPPPPDSAILGSPLQGNIPGKSLGSVQEKGLPASAAHSVFSAKDKNNAATQFMDVSQRKPPALPQSSQPGSSSNMLAPAFIFPLNQQQAAAAGAAAAAAAAASRSGVAKLTPGSGNTAQSSSSAGYTALGASGANGSGTSMSFNYPGLAPNEAQYLAFLQNNAYSFPIPAHVGGAQPYRGASPAQAMPFFNLSFYPSQMLHPSQIRLQQQPPSSQQPPYSQQGHQNPSTSSGSSSSQKNTQQSQRVAATAGTAITAGNSHGFPPSKHQHLSHAHQVRQLEPESGGEDAPSTADSRVSQAQKNIYAQKFAMPTHSQNFALIAPAAGALSSGVGNHGEKQQQQQQQQQSQNQVMKVDLTPSQAFAMSFASFGGAATGGAAPHGLDFSSMAQNHAIFQSLPETVRHSYQVSAAAAAAAHSTQQQQQQNKKPEDVKSAADLGNTSTVGEEGKISTASKVLGNAQQHSLTFSRADADSPISSILTNNVIDSSSRTLNLIQPPPSVAPRVSSRPASAAPASNSVSNSSNSQHLLSQQHQQQVLQLPKQVQQIQQQQQLILQQHRAKSSVSSHSSASLYTTDRLPGNSPASKFSPGLAGFPPALIQTSASSQPTQWKASTRAANPSSAVAALAAAASSASTSVKNQIPLQQQVRSQQPPAHQTQQISFGPAKVAGQSSQHLTAAGNNAAAAASLPSAATIAVGSPQNSVSKSSSGSPHSSAITKSVPPPPPVLPVLPFQKQQSGKNSSPNSISPLPATNRNMPSILGNPHISSPQNIGSKPQQPSQHLQQSQMPKQHSPQAQTAQLFFSYPYMQSQTSQSDAAAVAAGYFQQHHRRPSDSQRQNSTSASTGMLSLGPPSSLSLAAAPDPSKGGAGATATSNNSKNLMATSLLQHPAQFATISQPVSGANAAASAATGHPLMYIHAMQSVPLKPDVSSSAEQKPAAGR